MKKWFLGILCACCMLVPTMARATVTTRLGSGTVCPGSEVDILISVSDTMRNVGAISLAFSYDDTKLSYSNWYDAIPDITNSVLVNANNGKVYISWYSTTSITIGDTLLFIRFEGVESGNSSLTWDTQNCEYANEVGNIIESNYQNGSVTVYAQPAITSHPSDVSITAGNSVNFQVGASGQALTYQWQRKPAGQSNWTNLTNTSTYSNVTSYRLTVNNVTQQMTGDQFRCVVSGACSPEVCSNAATLSVSQTTIVTAFNNTTSCPGTVFAIPVTVTNCNNVGSFSLSFSYNASNVTYLGIQNVNSGMQTTQYQANASNGNVYFTWAGSGSSLDIGTGTLAEFLFEATPGNAPFVWNTAQCEYSDPTGNPLSASYSSGYATVYYAPMVTSNPVNRSVYEGNSTTFSINAGGQGISYTWQVSTDNGYTWTNCVNGTYYANVSSNTLTVRNVTVDMSGNQYRCVVCGTCEPCAYSAAATLTVNYIIHTSISGASACPGTVFNCPVTVSNFNNVGAVSLALNYNPDVLTFVDVTDVNDALPGLLSNANNGTVFISWYSTSGVSIGSGTLLQLLFTGVAGSSNLTWDANNSEYAMPDGTIITMTFNNASASIYSEPYVTSQPESQCLYAGQSTTFSINAGGQSIGYQWQVSTNSGASWSDLVNGEHYSNVTNRTLNVNNVTTGMNNYYFRCKVTGSCGAPVYSEYAKMAVDIAQPVVRAEDATWPCTGEVSQDIVVEHFDNIGAFSLVIDYDTNYLRYLEHFDLNPALQTTSFVINPTMGRIYLTYASGSAINIGSGKLLSFRFDSSGGNSTNTWQTNLCEVADIDGNVFNTTYINGYINVFSNCSFTDINSAYLWYDEIMDLCYRGIVTGYECQVRPSDSLKRSQLAKMLFIALFGSPNASVVTDGFPSPFLDLQKTNTYYYKYAKALSYLEYRDGISVFDRDKMNFNPEGNIQREYFIKALLETFHIPPLLQDTVIFADVPLERSTRGYINRAYKLGILVDINANNNTKYFNPAMAISRGDAMGYLDWLINLYNFSQPNNSQDITQSDFFIPGNYTPYNFTSVLGQEMGNFNHTTKSSFNIPARGFPLQFEHTYNSFLTELPRQVFATDPLGQGWTHNYNSYIINTDEVLDDYGHPLTTPCLLVYWADGTIHVYDNENAPEHPKAITKGVYNVLTKVNGNQYTVKMKDQTVCTFTKIAGAADDSPYMLTRMEDRHGNGTTLTYGIGENGIPRISTVSDDAGRDLVFTYHPNSNYLKKVTDPLSRSVSFVVEDDNLTAYVNAKGDSTFYYYDTLTHYNHLLDSIKLPKGNVITNTYEQRKLTSTKFNNGSPTIIQHNPNYVANANVFYSSTVTEQYGGNTVNSNYQYDKNGNQTHFNIGNTSDVTKTFDIPSDPNLLTSLTNNKTGMVIRYEYDSVGNTTKMTREGNGHTDAVQYEYNEQNDLIRQIDAKGNETVFNYENGLLTKVTNALNQETNFAYNAFGQPGTITDAVGNQVTFGYDSNGNTNSITFPSLNHTATMVYDQVSRMIQSTDFKGYTKSYVYDLDDALHKETNALGDSTVYAYDKNGNLIAIRNAVGDSTLFTFDFDKDQLLSMSFQSSSRFYEYNEDGTLHKLIMPNGDELTFEYDSEGRVTNDGYASYSYYPSGNLQYVTRNGKSVTYDYDIFNRMTSLSYDGQTIAYEYDENDNIVKLVYPGNNEVVYAYNALNQLTSVTDWNGNATIYNYRADGTLHSSLYPNLVLNEFDYDNAGRITGMFSKRNNGQGTDIVRYQFELDANGNQTSSLSLEQFIDMPVVDLPNVNYDYNGANRLLSDGVNGYQYDYNGNMTFKGSNTYNYDVVNNLISCSIGGIFSFTYDGNGNRRTASRNGELTKFVLGQKGNVLVELNSINEVQCYYIYGHGLISRIKPDNTTHYFIYDYRGSVVAMIDDTENANVTHKYQYDDFGNIIQMEEADFNPFRYLGKHGVTYESDELYYMHARYYDPTIGRFLSEDPEWNTNLYAYAGNNPIMKIDCSGNKWYWVEVIGYAWDDFIDDSKAYLTNCVAYYDAVMDRQLAKDNPNWFVYYGSAVMQGFCDIWIEDNYRDSFLWCLKAWGSAKAWEELIGPIINIIGEGWAGSMGFENGKWLTKVYGKGGILKMINMSTKQGKHLKELFTMGNIWESLVVGLKDIKDFQKERIRLDNAMRKINNSINAIKR